MSTERKNARTRATGRVTSNRKRAFTKQKATVAASFIATGALFFAIAATPAGASTTPSSSTTPTSSAPATAAPTATPSATASTTTASSTTTSSATTPSTPPQSASAASKGSTLATLSPTYQSFWLVTSRGRVYPAGGAPDYGTASGVRLHAPIVGMAETRTAGGYWLVGADGGVFAYGNAVYQGSMGERPLYKPIVGMAEDPATGGYWLVSADGGIFSFNAPYLGSMGGKRLHKPIVGMAATPTGQGYWLVGADGGVFSFGSALYLGSRGGHALRAPVVGMSAAPTGRGYRLIAADGGVFDYGTAGYYGSLGARSLPYPVTAITAMFSDKGYWMTTSQGGITNFGAARLFGRIPPLGAKVVGMAPAKGDGDPLPPSYPPGSYGYDVSNYQCGNFPSGAHSIGVVEIDGWGDTYTNPCFVTEVNWAGPGLNLYMFMVYGTSSSPQPGCSSAPVPTACNYGYITASSDFSTAGGLVNGRATVPWWLDIEQANWSSNKSANASVVMGAVDALHTDGVSTVGFYFALDGWTAWMGTYNPAGPLFPAWWGGPAPATKCKQARSVASRGGHFIPSGQIELIQYTDNVHGFDGDYSC